jgi:hypothetical protein
MKKVISFMLIVAIATSASADVVVEANASVPTVEANASTIVSEVNASKTVSEVNASKTVAAAHKNKNGFGYPSMSGISNPVLAVGAVLMIGGIFIVNKIFY